MKFTILALSVWAFVLTAAGAEKIEGAFGLKLGDVFQPKTESVFGGFEFKPEKRNSALSTYLVFITPASHRIFLILATGNAPDSATAEKKRKTIAALLHRKYADGPSQWHSIITQDARKVSVSVEDEVKVVVRYEDETLAAQAAEEARADELKKLLQEADGTGL